MRYKGIIVPIKKIWRETVWSWAFRLAVSITVPLLYGYFTGNLSEVFWAALAAQCLGLIELKGNFGNVIRILVIGALFSMLTCVVGSVSGNVVWIHIIVMFFVGLVATLFKNLGERGPGMALGFYIFYIISSAYPVEHAEMLSERVQMVAIGQVWVVFLAIIWMLVEKQGQSLRQTVSEVFYEMSVLTNKGRSGFGRNGILSSSRELFLQETAIRNKLNSSIEIFSLQDDEIYNKRVVEQIRKIAGLLNIQLLQILEEAHKLFPKRKKGNLDIQIHSLLRVWEQIFKLTHDYLLFLKPSEKLWLQNRIERLRDISNVIAATEYEMKEVQVRMDKIVHLSGRMSKLVERLLEIVDSHEEKRTFQSYSFSRMMSILHPKLFGNELSNFFRFEKNSSLYALRVGIGVFIGALIDYFFIPHHGYWIPFTTIIVVQPYIGATAKKGFERSLGTFFGAIAGFLLFEWLHDDIINIVLIFAATVLSIYFLRKRYSVTSFFVTLLLIGLLSLTDNSAENILQIRLLCTVLGSAIAIIVSFLFRSTWDDSMLPVHFQKALQTNYQYFLSSPVWNQHEANWLRLKRHSESANVKAFESYTRWTNEPKLNRDQKEIARYFAKINHLIRLTKEINNINLEWELNPNLDHKKMVDARPLLDVFHQLLVRYDIPIENLKVEDERDYWMALSPEQEVAYNKLYLELKALNMSG